MGHQLPVTIILVEDDPGHARLIEKNLRRAGLANRIVILTDGRMAVDYLSNGEESVPPHGAPPAIILLDLNLPVLDGYQVLQRLKGNDATRPIPVVVLTTTDNPQEIARCYELGCSICFTKPLDYERFSEAIRSLGHLLSVVQVPDWGNRSLPAATTTVTEGER